MRLRKSFLPDNLIHLSWFPLFPVLLAKYFPGFCCNESCFSHCGSWAPLKGTANSFLSLRMSNGHENVWVRLTLGNTFILNQCSNQEASAFIVVCSSALPILFKASDQKWYHFPGTINIFMCCIIFSVFEMALEMGLGRWIRILIYCELLCNRSDTFAFCISTLIIKLQRGYMADGGRLRLTLWSAKSKHDLEVPRGRHHSA